MSDSFATLRTVACQAPVSMEFPRREDWSRLPFPPPEDLPNPGIKPMSPALAGRLFLAVLCVKLLPGLSLVMVTGVTHCVASLVAEHNSRAGGFEYLLAGGLCS